MAFTLQISPVKALQGNTLGWSADLTTKDAGGIRVIEILDPITATGRPEDDAQDLIKWYLEKYVAEPFEATKADSALHLIREYGQCLAAQLSRSGLLPSEGHLEVEVLTPDDPALSSLQRLHWEVLGDVTLWPTKHKFHSVSVWRTTATRTEQAPSSWASEPRVRNSKRFNILLVVARPGGAADVEYQLVSRCLMTIAERVSAARPDVRISVEVLRPATWEAFQACLSEGSERRYDLVHLDMHGAIRKPKTEPTARYEWCKRE